VAFQTVTPAKLGQAAMLTSASILYKVPASTRTFVKDIDIGNTSSAPIMVYVYLVPVGGSPGPSTVLIPGISVPGNSILQWTGTQVLNANDTIQIQASGLGCTINASGGEAT
jgi:hypothetical protein